MALRTLAHHWNTRGASTITRIFLLEFLVARTLFYRCLGHAQYFDGAPGIMCLLWNGVKDDTVNQFPRERDKRDGADVLNVLTATLNLGPTRPRRHSRCTNPDQASQESWPCSTEDRRTDLWAEAKERKTNGHRRGGASTCMLPSAIR